MPLPTHIKNRLNLDLPPADLNFGRGYLLVKDGQPAKFEASGAIHSWVTSCTRLGRPTLPLTLTWISIGIIYSWWTIYLPSSKLMEQNVLELSVAQDVVYQLDLWPTDLVINRDHLLNNDYLPTKFEASGAKCSWVICCTRCGRRTLPLIWPEY